MIDGDHLSPSLLEGQRACESALLQERGQPSTSSETAAAATSPAKQCYSTQMALPSSGHRRYPTLCTSDQFASRFEPALEAVHAALAAADAAAAEAAYDPLNTARTREDTGMSVAPPPASLSTRTYYKEVAVMVVVMEATARYMGGESA